MIDKILIESNNFPDDSQQEFQCEGCKNTFSGIIVHYKCQKCSNIAMCNSCYKDTWIHTINHGVDKKGLPYKVIHFHFKIDPHRLYLKP